MPNEVAANVAKLTADNYDDDYVKETFGMITEKLVLEQPFKIPFVAGVVLYANAEQSTIAQDIIQRTGRQLQEALEKGRWREAKLLLRYLACLGPMFEEDGMMPILDELFSRAVDLQTASPEDVCLPIP